MAREVWQRESVWLGPTGVAAKVMRWGRPERVGSAVTDVEDLLSRPEWEGSEVEQIADCLVRITHPSGAVATLFVTEEDPC